MTADLFSAQPDDLPEFNQPGPDCSGIVPQRPAGRPEGVWLVGYVEGIDGARLPVGTDLSTVTVGDHIRLDLAGRERLGLLLDVAARLADAYAAQEASLDA